MLQFQRQRPPEDAVFRMHGGRPVREQFFLRGIPATHKQLYRKNQNQVMSLSPLIEASS